MDVVLRSNLPQHHKEIFNRVRLQLRLITASDIVVCSSSSRILPNILQGKNYRTSSYNWPTPHDLPKKWYDIFIDVIKSVIRPQLQSTPLGRWTSVGHQKWKYFIDPNTDTITTSTAPPPHLLAIDVENEENMNSIATKPPTLPSINQQIPHTPTQAIEQAPPWMKQLWRTTKWTPKVLTEIIQHIDEGNLIAAGKGAVRNQWGSYAWCFAHETTFARI